MRMLHAACGPSLTPNAREVEARQNGSHGRSALASTFTASLPPWLIEELPALAEAPPPATAEERVRLVNRLADRNWRAGNGGPFAAIVVDAASGALVSVGSTWCSRPG